MRTIAAVPTRDFFFIPCNIIPARRRLNLPPAARPASKSCANHCPDRRQSGELVFDTSTPGGMPRKILDGSRINQTGWAAARPSQTNRSKSLMNSPMSLIEDARLYPSNPAK
jgi:hypothetical protein